MLDGPKPISVFTVTASDAEMIARSHEAIQRSCELLNKTKHLTTYPGTRQYVVLPPYRPDEEA